MPDSNFPSTSNSYQFLLPNSWKIIIFSQLPYFNIPVIHNSHSHLEGVLIKLIWQVNGRQLFYTLERKTFLASCQGSLQSNSKLYFCFIPHQSLNCEKNAILFLFNHIVNHSVVMNENISDRRGVIWCSCRANHLTAGQKIQVLSSFPHTIYRHKEDFNTLT